MPTIFSIQKRALIPLTMFMVLALLLTGCGVASSGSSTGSSGGGAAGSGTTATPAPTTVKGYGSANGCPSDMVVSSTPSKVNVTLQSSDVNKTITAHNGDLIEVRLPFGHKWTGPIASPDILKVQSPSGYAWKTNNVCVWDFHAQGTGTVSLNFSGQPLCKRGQLCPMFIMVVPFKIDVK